jgi:hypothetical protein
MPVYRQQIRRQYQKQMAQSLTLKPFPVRAESDPETLSLTFAMPTDSVYVFSW